MSERKEREALPNTQEDWRKNEMCRAEEEGGGDLQVWAYRAGCYTTQNRKLQHRQLSWLFWKSCE